MVDAITNILKQEGLGGPSITAIPSDEMVFSSQVRGSRLHQDNVLLSQAWVLVRDKEERKEALVGATRGGEGGTMVFCNSVAACDAITKILKQEGVSVGCRVQYLEPKILKQEGVSVGCMVLGF